MYKERSLTNQIIGLAIEVHKELGPGLLENVYKKCMAFELANAGLKIEEEKTIPIVYKGLNFDCDYRIDLLPYFSLFTKHRFLPTLN